MYHANGTISKTIKQWWVTVSFIIMPIALQAQQAGHPAQVPLFGGASMGEKEILTIFQQAGDSLGIQDKGKDTMDSIANATTIFSEKMLRTHFDSLSQNGLIKKLHDNRQMVNCSELAQTVRQVFADQLAGGKAANDPLANASFPGSLPQGKAGLLEAAAPHATFDLPGFELEDAGSLEPLRGSILDTVHLRKLDSTAWINKAKTFSKLKETDPSDGLKRVVIPRPRSFFDDWYVEAVLGLADFFSDDGIAHVSPALARRFYGPFSLGVGPDLQFHRDNEGEDLSSNLGYRSFLKADLFENLAYLHFENIFNAQIEQDGDGGRHRHRFYAGGGYLMRLSQSWGLNFSLLYLVNDHQAMQEGSPWLVRVGFSTLKKGKER